MKSLLLIPLLFVGTPDGGTEAEEARRDLEALATRIQLGSARVLLEPDAAQREALARIADRVGAERRDYMGSWLSVLKLQKVAFTAFREQDLDGGEFEPGTEQVTAKANRLEKELRCDVGDDVSGVADLGREVLTPGQTLLLDVLGPEDFVRCALGPPDRAPGQPLIRTAWSALHDMERTRPSTVKRCALAGAQQILDVAARERIRPWDRPAELDRIAGLLERAASLPDAAAARCRGELAQELLPRTRDRYVKEGLDESRRKDRGGLSTFGRLLVAPGASDLLRGEVDAPLPPIEQEVRCLEEEVAALRGGINLLNLLNGLHLSRPQLKALAALGDEIASEAAPRVTGSALPAVLEALGYPSQFAQHPPESARDRRKLRQALEGACLALERGQLPKAGRGKWKDEKLTRVRGMPAGIRHPAPPVPRGPAALAILSPAQQRVLLEFSACLIPPRNLKDPVRVGQAGSDDQELAALKKAREVQPGRYVQRREHLAEGILSRIESHEGRFPPGEREDVLEELACLIDEMRGLDDAAFAVQGPELAARLRSLTHPIRPARSGNERRELERRAERWLLTARFPPLAREVAARRDARGVPDPIDLDTIAAAPSCSGDGTCAVD